MTKLFNGELCVVTGAASGIGRAVAERFLQEGADLVIGDFNKEGADRIYDGNEHVLEAVKMDATKIGDIEKLAEAVGRTGRKVKAVVPTIGNGPTDPIEAVTPEEFHKVMDLNVFSSFFTVQKILPYMSEKSAIVLISSIAGFQGGKDNIVYNAAKAAVRSMARSFAGELAERGIRANAISPGPTQTEGFVKFFNGDQEAIRGVRANIPIGHIGQPSEIASVAAFLASDQSTYVTGAEVITDGGFTNR